MFLNHLMNCCYCTCTFLKFALKLTFSVWLSTHSESFRYLAVITIEWMLFWGLFSPVDHVWHQNAKFEARASVARPPLKTSTFLLFWCIYFFQVELRMVSAFLRIIILHSFTWLLRHKYTFLCLLCQVCFPSLFVWSTTAVSWPSLSVLVQTHLMYTFLLCTFCTIVFPLSSWQLHWSLCSSRLLCHKQLQEHCANFCSCMKSTIDVLKEKEKRNVYMLHSIHLFIF